MAKISGSTAIGAGFRVISNNPGAVLLWGLTHLLIFTVPILGIYGAIVPAYVDLFQGMAAGKRLPPDASSLMHLQLRMMVLQPVLILCATATRAILGGAVFRAVLEPRNKGFGYIRLGRQELWLAIVYLVAAFMAILAIVCLIVPIIIGSVISMALAHGSGTNLWLLPAVIAPLLTILLGLGLWAAIRLSLALPMTFAHGKFMLFEAWPLARGNSLRMLGVGLGVYAMMILGQMVITVLVIGTGFLVLEHSAIDINQILHQKWDLTLARYWPWFAGIAAAGSMIAGLTYPIIYAPLADIYRQLAVKEDAA